MNKYNAAQYLPLVQALAEGKTIQCNYDRHDWFDIGNPVFSYEVKHYRIKPESIKKWYRVALMKHGTNTVCYDSDESALEGCEQFVRWLTERVEYVVEQPAE